MLALARSGGEIGSGYGVYRNSNRIMNSVDYISLLGFSPPR